MGKQVRNFLIKKVTQWWLLDHLVKRTGAQGIVRLCGDSSSSIPRDKGEIPSSHQATLWIFVFPFTSILSSRPLLPSMSWRTWKPHWQPGMEARTGSQPLKTWTSPCPVSPTWSTKSTSPNLSTLISSGASTSTSRCTKKCLPWWRRAPRAGAVAVTVGFSMTSGASFIGGNK